MKYEVLRARVARQGGRVDIRQTKLGSKPCEFTVIATRAGSWHKWENLVRTDTYASVQGELREICVNALYVHAVNGAEPELNEPDK